MYEFQFTLPVIEKKVFFNEYETLVIENSDAEVGQSVVHLRAYAFGEGVGNSYQEEDSNN